MEPHSSWNCFYIYFFRRQGMFWGWFLISYSRWIFVGIPAKGKLCLGYSWFLFQYSSVNAVKSVTKIIYNYYHYYYRFKPCLGLAVHALGWCKTRWCICNSEIWISFYVWYIFKFYQQPLIRYVNVHCHLSLFFKVVVCILLYLIHTWLKFMQWMLFFGTNNYNGFEPGDKGNRCVNYHFI